MNTYMVKVHKYLKSSQDMRESSWTDVVCVVLFTSALIFIDSVRTIAPFRILYHKGQCHASGLTSSFPTLQLFNGRFRMSDAMSGPLDAMLTSRSTSSMSPAASPTRTASMAKSLSPSLASTNNHSFLASTRGQSLGSTLASRKGRRQRQEQNQAPPGRVRSRCLITTRGSLRVSWSA